MKLTKTICLGALLTTAFSVAFISNNAKATKTKAEEDVYDLRTGFANEVGNEADITGWGTPWGVESINIVELFNEGQGFTLEDGDCKLPEYDSSSEWGVANLSLFTYPVFHNAGMTEGNGFFNQYPIGWKMATNTYPENVATWPEETGYCSADNTYLKYYHSYTNTTAGFHPGKGCGVVVYFTAPKTGNIYISDSAHLDNPSNKDGTYFFIYKIPATSFTSHLWNGQTHHGLFGGSPIYPSKESSPTSDWSTWVNIPKTGTLNYQTDTFAVEKGDVIAWVYGGGTSIDYDTTQISTKVTYVEDYDYVELSSSSIKMAKGETKTLTASVYPKASAEKSITWTSSDPNVATVENGVVTGVNDGTATIKAVVNDGTVKSGDSDVSATCTVVVAGNHSVKITNKTSALTFMQGDSINMAYETFPQSNEITWSIVSGNENATIDNDGVVTGLLAGNAVVRATVSGTNTYDEVTITVKTASNPVLTLSESGTISVEPDSTYTLDTSITPAFHANDNVVVSVADSSIITASWENKVITITAVAQGTTKLYATVLNGNTITLDVQVTKNAVKVYEWEHEFGDPMPTKWEQAMIEDDEYNTDLSAFHGQWGYSYSSRQGIQGICYKHPDFEDNAEYQYWGIFGGQGVHPLKGKQACVAFVAPNGGTLDYSSHFVSQDSGSSQQFKIMLNDEQIYPEVGEWKVIDGSHPAEVYLFDLEVEKGDKIYTIVDSGVSDSSDFCFINPTIKYTEMVPSPGEIEIDTTELTLTVGEYHLIKYTIPEEDYRDRKIYWSTSDEKVATVNENGEVTAIHKGTATISCTLENGNTVTCSVTVLKPEGGCGGSVIAASAILSSLSLLGVGLLIAKKKDE